MVDTYRYSLRLPALVRVDDEAQKAVDLFFIVTPFAVTVFMIVVVVVFFRCHKELADKLVPLLMSFMTQMLSIVVSTVMETVDIFTDIIAFAQVLGSGKRSNGFMAVYATCVAIATVVSIGTAFVRFTNLKQLHEDTKELEESKASHDGMPSDAALHIEGHIYRRDTHQIIANGCSALLEDAPMLAIMAYIIFFTEDSNNTILASTFFNMIMLGAKLSFIQTYHALKKVREKIEIVRRLLRQHRSSQDLIANMANRDNLSPDDAKEAMCQAVKMQSHIDASKMQLVNIDLVDL